MKKISITFALCFIFSLFLYSAANADVYKWVKVGSMRDRVIDSINQGVSAPFRNNWLFYYYDNFMRRNSPQTATYLVCKDWTDPDGNYYPYMQTGAGGAHSDEVTVTMPVPDAEGLTIHAYHRITPPKITVDGNRLDDFFPQEGDEVAPDKIPGTADIMIESTVNTHIGITIHQKVLAWSQINHDDYILYDWTFTNTGNTDLDDDIELPSQTIKGLYVWRATRYAPAGLGPRYQNWYSHYGEHPEDTLRISYGYTARRPTSTKDDVGYPSSVGFLQYPQYMGEATLHVDRAPNDPTDWRMMPFVTGTGNCDIPIANWLWYELSADEIATQYLLYSQGFTAKAGLWDNTEMTEGVWPGSHHSVRMDELGIKWVKDNHFYTWHPWTGKSSGPWDLKIGESIRYVYSMLFGSISPRVGWDVGRAWQNGKATETWKGPWNLPPQYTVYPELCKDDNDRAKDSWVFTGKDSLFQNAYASQWAVRNDYDVPTPPSAPSIEIKSLPDRVRIEWDGTESEKASDFAGYRVYRTIPTKDSIFWYQIFECGKGTPNALTHRFDDATASRGIGYAYYVTAFDDGIGNKTDVHGRKESLESGKYLNETTLGLAHLTRPPAAKLSDVRVVPNPFNIGAENLQYPGEPDKIMFLDLPGYCTIKIYTESGDLIKTLYHTSGSGDESWGNLLEEHSATDDGQIVVSGIYIAYIEENNEDSSPTGNTTAIKFVVVR